MTSIAVQPAWATTSSSAGRGPLSPSALSMTIVWPLPVRATNRDPSPSSRTVAVFVAIGIIPRRQTRPFGTVCQYVLLNTILPRCQSWLGLGGRGGCS